VTAELAVVIPTHQRRDLLVRVLAALATQTLARERFTVTVVCDGCSDGSADAARRAVAAGGEAAGLRLRVMEQANAGAATARNRGAEDSDAGLLLFLDDDMIAQPDLLAVHLEQHRQRPGTIIIGHLPVHPDSPPSYLTLGLARWVDRRHQLLSQPGAPVPVDEVLTGQMSMAREIFQRLEGFDTRFTAGGTFGGEDVELGWRARDRGVAVVYQPRAVSQQVYRKTFTALCRNIRDAAAADSLMAAVHPGVAAHLPLGQMDSMPLGQRLALRTTLKQPRMCAALFSPLLALLNLAAARGWSARIWEHLHGIARAHLYGLGMRDAEAAGISSRRTA